MTPLQDRRVWIGGGLIAAFLVAIAGWFFAISPELSSADSLRSETANTEMLNISAQAKLNALKNKSEHKDELVSSLRSALAALPADSGLPDLTRQVSAQASATHVTLTSITVGATTAVGAPAGAPANVTSAGLSATAITLSTNGTLAQQVAFLHAVQVDGPRRALVTSVQLTPSSDAGSGSVDGASTWTIQLSVFSQPQTAQQRAQLDKLLAGNLTR